MSFNTFLYVITWLDLSITLTMADQIELVDIARKSPKKNFLHKK